jgi:hypothetical protein
VLLEIPESAILADAHSLRTAILVGAATYTCPSTVRCAGAPEETRAARPTPYERMAAVCSPTVASGTSTPATPITASPTRIGTVGDVTITDWPATS